MYRFPISIAAILTILIPCHASGDETPGYLKIYGDRTVGQLFQYPMSNLDRVGVRIRKTEASNQADLIFRLRKSPTAAQDIAVIRTPLAEIASDEVHWFRFRPLGDDEDPAYYAQIESPASTEDNAPEVRITQEPVPWTLGPAHIDGVEQTGFLTIQLRTDRSLRERIGYVLARFETDKPWFYNRYFYAALFIVYSLLVLGFLVYTYRLLVMRHSGEPDTTGIPRFFVVFVTVLFLTRGLLYSSLFPAWQAPDEPAHFSTISYIEAHRALPPWDATIDRSVIESMDRADYASILRGGRPRPDWQTWIKDPRAESIRERRAWLTTPGAPFLFHVVFSVPFGLISTSETLSQLFIMRFIMALVSCLIIYIAYRSVRLLSPATPSLHILVPSVLCFIPVFTYISSSVSYDVLTNVLSAGFLWCMIADLSSGASRWRYPILGGILLGAGLLTKAAVLMLLPAALVWWGLAGWDASERLRQLYRFLALGMIAFAIGGWWYARNVWQHGTLVYQRAPSWSTAGEMNSDLGLLTVEQLGWILVELPWHQDVWHLVSRPFVSIVGYFGWGNAPLSTAYYVVAACVGAIACIGLARACLKSPYPSVWVAVKENRAVAGFTAAFVIYVFLLLAARGQAAQGRYFFPVIVPGVFLLAGGLSSLIPVKYRPWGNWAILTGFVVFDTLVLLETIIPRYYLIPPPSSVFKYLL